MRKFLLFRYVSRMDGLSLLGMVAEQRLGEAGPRKEVVIGGAKEQVIMVRRDIVVKPEDVKVELQETEDDSMNVDDGEMLGEFESSTSNINVKCEAEESMSDTSFRPVCMSTVIYFRSTHDLKGRD